MISALSELHSFFRGKSVALIGGSLETIEHDKALDCDIIFSAHNHAQAAGLEPHAIIAGWDVPHLVPRTELCVVNIANPTCHETFKACAVAGVRAFAYDSLRYARLNPNGCDFEWCNAFSNELRTYPFTGIVALKLLLSLPIQSVFVTGYTFYISDKSEFPYRVGSHNVEPQVRWFRTVLRSDRRVSCDSRLKQLFPMYKDVTPNVRTRVDERGIHWRL